VGGYLFIVVFVTVCAMLAFNRQFFTDNLATLDQLNRYFPLLLLFLVPAITMSTWAEERRLGTDAILFTLPASDLEILLGKYLSVVAVYSIALAFSVTQLIALANIGQPDWGVVASVYLGYWLAGCALLSVGMFASR
jgi:ABC-2 type transport system permease protein